MAQHPENEFTITISDDASKKLPDGEEVKLLVKYALAAFKEEPKMNTFKMGRLGLVLVVDKNEISIITEGEMEEILGK